MKHNPDCHEGLCGHTERIRNASTFNQRIYDSGTLLVASSWMLIGLMVLIYYSVHDIPFTSTIIKLACIGWFGLGLQYVMKS